MLTFASYKVSLVYKPGQGTSFNASFNTRVIWPYSENNVVLLGLRRCDGDGDVSGSAKNISCLIKSSSSPTSHSQTHTHMDTLSLSALPLSLTDCVSLSFSFTLSIFFPPSLIHYFTLNPQTNSTLATFPYTSHNSRHNEHFSPRILIIADELCYND